MASDILLIRHSQKTQLHRAYEQLRDEAIPNSIQNRNSKGLWLFITTGMFQWLTIWTQCHVPTSKGDTKIPHHRMSSRISTDFHEHIAILLANMVFCVFQEDRIYDTRSIS